MGSSSLERFTGCKVAFEVKDTPDRKMDAAKKYFRLLHPNVSSRVSPF
jgi:hypothetical protein